ncbi:MAG TPA: hypothetical protein DCP96_06835 [Lachnospiraceae bacterium]|jgi:diguanylate cyclase (GGDEF)-like protein|nr:hypothetical protein [Lachnospiraceae bacterium]
MKLPLIRQKEKKKASVSKNLKNSRTSWIGRRRITISVGAIFLIFVFMVIINRLEVRVNRNHSFEMGNILIDQVEHLIKTNSDEEDSVTDALKEACISKAKAASYMIDHGPDQGDRVSTLKHIGQLLNVDEVHIFDEKGVIVSGTNPQYYGLSFSSGVQMGFFSPMLQDKKLTLCQDVTPNTAENKRMMYAITWNDAGTQMVQIGISPVRVFTELRGNSLDQLLTNMPTNDGTEVLITDKDYKILSSTESKWINKNLSSVKLLPTGGLNNSKSNYDVIEKGQRYYCSAEKYNDYYIFVCMNAGEVNHNIPYTMTVVMIYMILAALVIIFVVRKMTQSVIQEHESANTDGMTGFLNRRAYENYLLEHPGEPQEDDFIFAFIDINGLKKVNDEIGHEAGDELITTTAECIQQAFGNYGDAYRLGGDEFAVIFYADELQQRLIVEDFQDLLQTRRGNLVHSFSASIGCVSRREFPGKTIQVLSKVADDRMYEDKERYYEKYGKR